MKSFRDKASKSYQLRLNADRDVENTFRAYETSFETERLSSEQNRQIYCELFDLDRKKTPEKISEIPDSKSSQAVADESTIDDDNEEQEQVVAAGEAKKWWTEFSVDTNRPKTLRETSIETVAKAYKSGSIDERIWCQDAVDFGRHADIELPILDLLQLHVKKFVNKTILV